MSSRSVVRTVALSLLLVPLGAWANVSTRPVPTDVPAYDERQAATLSSLHEAKKASGALIYVSTSAGIAVFDQNGNGPVEQIPNNQGILAVDTQGNLYVSSGHVVTVYAPGQTTPTRTIHLANAIQNFDLDTHGDIWGTIVCSTKCQQPALFEFDKRGKLLQALSCSAVQLYYGLTVDAAGDAFVDGYATGGLATVVEWPAGSTACQVLNTHEQGSGGLQVTKAGNLVVDDTYQVRSLTYAGPRFDKLIATTAYVHEGFNFSTRLRNGGHQIWVSAPQWSTITRYPYPAGGTGTVTIGSSQLPGYPGSIAVSPCAEPNC